MNEPIYLDYNATTPIDPRVREAMMPCIREHYGNPSSGHSLGRRAAAVIVNAREQVADLLGADPDEIVFTGGGSESNNTVLKGVVSALADKGDHIITTAIEHPAVLEPCRYLERHGCGVSYLPVDGAGMVDPDQVRSAITPRTVLISVMHANNEVGTIEPIAEIGRIARDAGVLFHTDAAQSVGKIPVSVGELNVDFLSVAGHKLYAPKGVGALYIRRGITIDPLIHGAGHESGRRAGTENTVLIAALGTACRLAGELMADTDAAKLRDRLWTGLRDALADRVVLNGHPTHRLPNTLNVSFLGHRGADILKRLEAELLASTGSACHAGQDHPSPALTAMGIGQDRAMAAVRLTVGRFTTGDMVDAAIAKLTAATRQSVDPVGATDGP